MFSLFNQQPGASLFHQPLLNEKELLNSRAVAEQLDCSLSSEYTLDSRQAGGLPTRALGGGMDYAESRPYQPGDDPRLINWRLSARSQETFVKTYHIESRPSISIFLDRRRSMLFGTQKRLKITQAMRVAALLTYASEYHHLAFQGWIIDDQNGVQFYDNCEEFLHQANRPCPDIATIDSNLAEVNITAFLKEASLRTSKGSLFYLISDLNGFSQSQQSNLAQLQERCFIQTIHISDKAEFNFPPIGKMRLQDMNQDRNYSVNSQNKKEWLALKQRAEEVLEQKKSVITDLGIPFIQLTTDMENIHQQIILPLGQT